MLYPNGITPQDLSPGDIYRIKGHNWFRYGSFPPKDYSRVVEVLHGTTILYRNVDYLREGELVQLPGFENFRRVYDCHNIRGTIMFWLRGLESSGIVNPNVHLTPDTRVFRPIKDGAAAVTASSSQLTGNQEPTPMTTGHSYKGCTKCQSRQPDGYDRSRCYWCSGSIGIVVVVHERIVQSIGIVGVVHERIVQSIELSDTHPQPEPIVSLSTDDEPMFGPDNLATLVTSANEFQEYISHLEKVYGKFR